MLHDQRRQLRDHLAAGDQLGVGRRRLFDPENRDADRIVASEDVGHLGIHVAARLGDEKRIAVLGVLRAKPDEVGRAVNVGRHEIDLRPAGPPDVHHEVPGAAVGGRELGDLSNAVQRRVDVHRQRIFGLAGLDHVADVPRIVPGHEDPLHRATLAEDLFPRPGGLEARRLPRLAKQRDQRLFVLLEVVHQLLGHLPGKGLGGHRRVVAGNGMHADFVLDLDHDDRVLPAVNFLDVPHQGGEGAGVGVAVRLAEDAQFFDGLVPFELARGNRWKSFFTQSGM